MAENQDEPQFVVVKDPQRPEECLELPTNSAVDGRLALVTLEHAVPGAYGLKYKNPKTGATRVVSVDETGKNFVPPPGGWTEKLFEIIFRTATASPQAIVDATPKEKPSNKQESRKRTEKVTEGSAGAVQFKAAKEKEVIGGGSDAATKKRPSRWNSAGEMQQEDEKRYESSAGGVESSKRPKSDSKLAAKRDVPCSDLIVQGLPPALEEGELRAYFENNFGPLDQCQLKFGPNGESLGSALIRTAEYYAQVRILSRVDHQIGGHRCQCRLPFVEGSNDAELEQKMEGRVPPRLFIRGLKNGVRLGAFRGYFQKHAKRIDKNCAVTDCFVQNRFAFVSLSSAFVARELIRQGDFLFEDMELWVSEATPRENEEQLSANNKGQGGGGGASKGAKGQGGNISVSKGKRGRRRRDGNPPTQKRGARGKGKGGMPPPSISPWVADERALLVQKQLQIMAEMGGHPPQKQLQLRQSMPPYINPGYTEIAPRQYIGATPFKQRRHMEYYGYPRPVPPPPPPYICEEDPRLLYEQQQQSSGSGGGVGEVGDFFFMDRGDQGAHGPWMDSQGPSPHHQHHQQQMMGDSGDEELLLPPGFTPEMLQVAARWLHRQGGGGRGGGP